MPWLHLTRPGFAQEANLATFGPLALAGVDAPMGGGGFVGFGGAALPAAASRASRGRADAAAAAGSGEPHSGERRKRAETTATLQGAAAMGIMLPPPRPLPRALPRALPSEVIVLDDDSDKSIEELLELVPRKWNGLLFMDAYLAVRSFSVESSAQELT